VQGLILVIEDEVDLASTLEYAFEREGFHARLAHTGADGLAAAAKDPLPDAIVLDLMLPDLSGTEVFRRLREQERTRGIPVLICTAKGSETDRVVGLELGADDYVVKPFGLRELVARIRAVLRRSQRRAADVETLEVGDLALELRSRRATIDGHELQLTVKEYDLLALLMRDPGAVVTKQRILNEVWNTSWYGSSKTVDVHVASLRKKLGDPGLIETVRGVGLRLRAPE
jgi:DNA-binding response OmpR family regulator